MTPTDLRLLVRAEETVWETKTQKEVFFFFLHFLQHIWIPEVFFLCMRVSRPLAVSQMCTWRTNMWAQLLFPPLIGLRRANYPSTYLSMRLCQEKQKNKNTHKTRNKKEKKLALCSRQQMTTQGEITVKTLWRILKSVCRWGLEKWQLKKLIICCCTETSQLFIIVKWFLGWGYDREWRAVQIVVK